MTKQEIIKALEGVNEHIIAILGGIIWQDTGAVVAWLNQAQNEINQALKSLQGSIIINERDIPRDMEESVSDMKIWAKDFWDSDQVLVNNYDYKNIMKFMNFILEEHFMNKKQKALEDFERFLRETKAKRMIIDQGNIEFPEGDDSYKIGDNYLDTETIETIRTALSRPSVLDDKRLEKAIWYCREDWQPKDGMDALYEEMDIIISAVRDMIHERYVVGER